MEVDRGLNKKGFTLIELLAVIVILAILMTLAITSMSGVISKAKRDTFVTTALQYSNSIRFKVINGEYEAPSTGACTIVATNQVELDGGKNQSPFGKAYKQDVSFVAVHNSGTNEKPAYTYYIQMVDSDNNGFVLIEENSLENNDVLVKNIGKEGHAAKQMVAQGNPLVLKEGLSCNVEYRYAGSAS